MERNVVLRRFCKFEGPTWVTRNSRRRHFEWIETGCDLDCRKQGMTTSTEIVTL